MRVLRLMTVNTVEEHILAAAKYKLNVDSKVSCLCKNRKKYYGNSNSIADTMEIMCNIMEIITFLSTSMTNELILEGSL